MSRLMNRGSGSVSKSRTVLVVGGAGYIGSHVARALRAHGWNVIIYDNLCNGYVELVKDFEFVQGDIADAKTLKRVMRYADAVMHFAAHAYVTESVEAPRKYFSNNVAGSLSLLESVLDNGAPPIVFSSTCAVYGVPGRLPIDEETPRRPISPYGVSKLLVEQALEAYERAYGLRFAILRYFNAAGADESGTTGECHDPETHLIPLALDAARQNSSICIYGTDYPTGDGTCIRDYIHVGDLASAHVKALEYIFGTGTSTILNVGTGRGYSVREIIAVVEQISGRPVTLQFADRRPGDPPALLADPRRAEMLLGWKATRTLQDMVSSAWNWLNRGVTAQAADIAQNGCQRPAILAAPNY